MRITRASIAALILFPPLALPGCSGGGGSGSGNSAPVAGDDLALALEDGEVLIDVLVNDSDHDAELVTVEQVSFPANGEAVIEDGKIRYTPDANFFGTDSFTYTVADPHGKIDSAAVTVSVTAVNDLPSANQDPITTAEDTPVAIAVLANDSDIDLDLLFVFSVSAPTHGVATIVSNDSMVLYSPEADFAGDDGFSYTLGDGIRSSVSAPVSITVSPVNDAPVASTDNLNATEDATLNLAAPGLLGNDSDIDSSSLTASVVLAPTHGDLTLGLDGAVSFVPDANYFGADEFTYRASDGVLSSTVTTVNLAIGAVNDAPVAGADSFNASEDTPLVAGSAAGVLSNDTDIDSASLTVTLTQAPSHGSLSLATNGAFTFTPAADYSGPDSFQYTVSDGAASAPGAATIAVANTNDPPVGNTDSYSVDENTSLIANALSGVLANDNDVDSVSLTGALTSQAGNGTVVLDPSGSFTYTPNTDFFGTDTFEYEVSDGVASDGPILVSIEVRRDFAISVVGKSQVVLPKSGGKSLEIAVGAADAVVPVASVTVSATGLPANVTVTPVTIAAGSTGTLVFQTTSNVQSAWSGITITGTLGPKNRTTPARLRVRGSPGEMDINYGMKRINLGSTADQAHDIAIQADGKIVLAARSASNPILVRLTEDAVLDATFGANGVAILPTGGDPAFTLAIQDDGKILAGTNGGIMRVLTDGAPDATFDNGARDLGSYFGMSTPFQGVTDIAILSDGSIALCGTFSVSNVSSAVVGRLDSSGVPVPDYGTNGGFTELDWAQGSNNSVGGIAVDSATGAVAAVGRPDFTFQGVGAARVDVDGLLDPVFDGDGLVTTTTTGLYVDDGLRDAILMDDGQVIGVGTQRTIQDASRRQGFIVARGADGSDGLGGAGEIYFGPPSGFAEGWALGRDAMNRLLFVGSVNRDNLVVGRYSSSGVSDSVFNSGGEFHSYPIPSDPLIRRFIPQGVTTDGEGGILVTGLGFDDGANIGYDIVLVRIWD